MGRRGVSRESLACSGAVRATEGIPVITDAEQAIRSPELAVLSVMAHGKGDPHVAVSIARAVFAAAGQLPEDQRMLYSTLVEAALGEAARKAFEMIPDIQKFFNESQRSVFAKGKAEGKAEGEAGAVLRVLAKRGLGLSEAQRERILGCTSVADLDRWLDRALTVTSTEDLFASETD